MLGLQCHVSLTLRNWISHRGPNSTKLSYVMPTFKLLITGRKLCCGYSHLPSSECCVYHLPWLLTTLPQVRIRSPRILRATLITKLLLGRIIGFSRRPDLVVGLGSARIFVLAWGSNSLCLGVPTWGRVVSSDIAEIGQNTSCETTIERDFRVCAGKGVPRCVQCTSRKRTKETQHSVQKRLSISKETLLAVVRWGLS
jgi:hypothetical protein